MRKLASIGVRLEGPRTATTGQARAILRDIRTHLATFVETGRPARIDLKSLPMSAGDHEELRRMLGGGAIEATVRAIGRIEVRETRYAGVWWLRHQSDAGERVQEWIEVSAVPEVLTAPPEDLRSALNALGLSVDHPS